MRTAGTVTNEPALRPPQAASCHPLGVRSRIQVSPERYHQIARAALALLTLIVFTGAAVRLTGSGLGCPDWPKCTDDRLVSELDTHGLIEFVNRVFSGLVALIAVAAGVLAYFRTPYRRDLMLLGLLLPLGVLGQGVLGGLTVIYDLRPGFVMSHFGLSMLILVAAWALHWRSRPAFEDERAAAQASPPDRATLWAARLLTPIGALTVFAGTAATASGPARRRRGHRRRRRPAGRQGLGHARLGDPPARLRREHPRRRRPDRPDARAAARRAASS